MNLEVGEFYLSAGGEIIEINFFNRFSITSKFEDINGNTYFKNGKYDGDCREFDLIAYIPKELHFHICQMIATYHTQPNYAEKVNLTFEIFNMKSEEIEANKIVDELVEELEKDRV